MKHPKSQISIFVIISVILVLSFIIIISTSNSKLNFFTEDKPSVKIKTYIESCLELQSKQAQEQIGIHSGWLYHPQMILASREKNKYENKIAQGLNFLEKVEMPYWYYYDDTKETFELNIPQYDTDNTYSIKNQFKKYLDDNLENNCIQGFSAFEGIYKIKYEPKDIDTQITLTEKEVIVELDLPIEITELNENNTEYIDSFKSEIENKILIPYLIARDIVVSEANSSFFEKRIMQFLTPYQTSETRDLLPPQYDFKMQYDFRPWEIPKVETLAKQIINSNIGQIKFLNSEYELEQLPEELKNNEFANGVYNAYLRDYVSENSLTKKDAPNLFKEYQNYEINPTFEPFFPMFFSISPSLGDVILLPRPEAIIGLVPIFFTEYLATYEISAPIVVQIKKPDPNDKFQFNLPIETNIAHNTPLKENYVFDFNLEDLDISNTKSLVCDPPQFISEYISINITDPINYGNNKPDGPKTGVEDAIVTFTCKNIATCYIGQTSTTSKSITNNITELKFRVPVNCDPGTLEIYKYGHKKITIDNLNPTLNEPINLGEYEMPSSKPLKVNIGKLTVKDSKFAKPIPISRYEEGFVIFENKEEKDFTRLVQVNENNTQDLEIELMPGNYTIKGFLNYNREITIREENSCYEGGCTTLPEMKMESWIKGGIEIENFEVTTKDLLNRNEITINFIEYGIPGSYDSLEQISETMGDLKQLSESKKPYLD